MPAKRPRGWTLREASTLAEAVQLAPSVHNVQPWRLALPGREVLLFERADLALPEHDPSGRDLTISGGAAVADIQVAIRALGWRRSSWGWRVPY